MYDRVTTRAGRRRADSTPGLESGLAGSLTIDERIALARGVDRRARIRPISCYSDGSTGRGSLADATFLVGQSAGYGFGHETRQNRCEQAGRGETGRTAERRWPAAMRPRVPGETVTGWLITQRSQVRILSPLPAEMTPEV